jgi:acyl carrier protein
MDSLLFLELSSDIQHDLGVRINAERAWQDLAARAHAAYLRSGRDGACRIAAGSVAARCR